MNVIINPVLINVGTKRLNISTRSTNSLGQARTNTTKSLLYSYQELMPIQSIGTQLNLLCHSLSKEKTINNANPSLHCIKRLINDSNKKNSLSTMNASQDDFLVKISSHIKASISAYELYHFIINPLSEKRPLICNMKISFNNIFEQFLPTFTLYLNNNEREIMMAKKQFKLSSIVYKIYLCNKEKIQYLGKIKSNLLANDYVIYERILYQHIMFKTKVKKKQIVGFIKYNCQPFFLSNKPRDINVFLPKKNNTVNTSKIKKTHKDHHLVMNLTKNIINSNQGKLNNSKNTDNNNANISINNKNYNNESKYENSNMLHLQNEKPIWSNSKQIFYILML